MAAPQVILAHRGLLDGPDPAAENTRTTLARAVERGFGVEFDVNDDGGRLTLSHDGGPWSEERDAEAFLAAPGPGLHALNVKSLAVLDRVLETIGRAGTRDSFLLFDFELLGASPETMRGVQEEGFRVAHRASEREPAVERHADEPAVTDVWLDEFDEPWLAEEHVRRLAEAGKRTFYVSPELHRPLRPDRVEPRWREVAAWGVTGICTDYPLRLSAVLGGST